MSNNQKGEESVKNETVLGIDFAEFKDRLQKMVPFMSTEETRYYLCGVLMKFDGKKLFLVATNGHILCESTFYAEAPKDTDEGKEALEPFEVICPAKAVKDLIRAIPRVSLMEGKLRVFGDGKKKISFEFDETEYVARCIDGSFPDYLRVIPDGKVKMREGMNAKYLLAALKALGNVAVDVSVDTDGEDGFTAPHLLTSKAMEGMRCVVMPMRA